MASLCREFGISRKTGYKILERYEECGWEGLTAVLDRHQLVTRMNRSRTHAEGTPLSYGVRPNELWCTDYKGEF